MQSEKQIAAAQGVLGRGGVYVGAELVKAALEAALPAAEPVPVAYRHTLHMDLGQTDVEVNTCEKHPFGRPDVDYSPEYRITTEPLYATPPAPSVAVKAKLIAELREMAGSITYAEEPSRVMREAADALSAQVQDVAGWQPIETAPKDGTQFLAFYKGSYLNCWWHDNGYGEQYWMDDADSEPNPSHWMPLPAAPAKQEGGHD